MWDWTGNSCARSSAAGAEIVAAIDINAVLGAGSSAQNRRLASLFCQCARFLAIRRGRPLGWTVFSKPFADHFADDHSRSKMCGAANDGRQFGVPG